MGTKPEMALFELVKLRLDKLEREGWIEKIRTAPRSLCSDLAQEVATLNTQTSSPHWSAEHNEQGPFIRCHFAFSKSLEALVALNALYFLQEKVDHHTAFTFSHFQDLNVELCTHQPKWGVTHVDLAFAQALTVLFS